MEHIDFENEIKMLFFQIDQIDKITDKRVERFKNEKYENQDKIIKNFIDN